MDRGACRSCRAQVSWARSIRTRKPMPLDEDNARGNVLVDSAGFAHSFRNHQVALATAALDEEKFGVAPLTYLAHHATCPAAERWRGQQRNPAPTQGEQEAMF